MCQLIETIKINKGCAENIFWHNKRFNETRKELFGIQLQTDLKKIILVPEEYKKGEVKCRIGYGKEIDFIEFERYDFRQVRSLKIVYDDLIRYDHKYRDRSHFNTLYTQKSDKDDILIVKKGLVSDTSYCNLVFSDGKDYFTPSTPLLKGTKRAKYLFEGKIKEREIAIADISKYQEIHLINAFIDLNRVVILIKNIN